MLDSALRGVLEPWCAMGATGALRVIDPPGGTLYLSQGRIVYAECPTACGADRLLTASGQVGADAWRAARTLARAGRSLAEVLLEQGLLAPVELESAVLCALHSAAYFLLHAEAAVHVEAVHFEVDVRHAFGSVVEVELRTACDEADRRRDALAEAWPDSTMDISAVLPVRRLPGHLVALTGLQWEVVANADRRRTPVDLARVLGRDTFAMLLEVRRMARAGLVEPGRPAPPPARGVAPVRPPEVLPDPPDPPPDPPAGTNGYHGPLPRRAGHVSLVAPEPLPGPLPEPGDPDSDCWEDMLLRIRDALEAL